MEGTQYTEGTGHNAGCKSTQVRQRKQCVPTQKKKSNDAAEWDDTELQTEEWDVVIDKLRACLKPMGKESQCSLGKYP